MKKIGILTFHISNNYGAVLQAYALQTCLHNLGHDVEIIDYKPWYLLEPYRLLPKLKHSNSNKLISMLKYTKSYLMACVNSMAYFKYTKSFNLFRAKSLNLSSESMFTNSTNFNYDLYVLGSDQIWNSNVTKGLDDIFWGNFTRKNKSKIITYAASSSFYAFTEDQKKQIAKYLIQFSAISTREEELKKYLKINFNINSQLVCDPTLLVDYSVWNKMAEEPDVKGYVLTYFTSPKTLQVANKIAKAKGLKVVSIYNIYDRKNRHNIYSPNEFVGLFKHADYVVSSSYHGLAFSLIFNKEFCILGSGKSSDSRMLSILNMVNINRRYLTDICNMDIRMFDSEIDYSIVNEKLAEFRKASTDFLKSNI